MHTLGIAFEERVLVAGDLLETGKGDCAKRLTRRDPGWQRDRIRLDGCIAALREKLVAALRFARQRKFGARCPCNFTGNLEELGLAATLGLDLEFAQRSGLCAGIDLSDIEGQLDFAVGERVRRAAHPSLKYWAKLRFDLLAEQRLESGLACRAQIRLLVADLGFPFVPIQPGTLRLDGLEVL